MLTPLTDQGLLIILAGQIRGGWNTYSTQKSATVNLSYDIRYYIEAIMKEGTGLDNLAVGWLKPGQTGTTPSEVLPGSVLSLYSASTLKSGNNSLPVNEMEETGVKMYPNPATNVVTIETSFETGTVSIVSALGKKVLDKQIVGAINRIDVSNLNSGLYFIIVKGGNKTITKKLQIVK